MLNPHEILQFWQIVQSSLREEDAKGKAAAKHDADAQESPAIEAKKAKPKKEKKESEKK